MRPKNFNFIERYVEKVVLALAALFFLLVGWLYFLGDPYLVTLKIRGQDVTLKPNEIEDRLLDQANDLRMKVNSSENPLPEIKIADYVDDFRKRATRPSLTVGEFAMPLSEMGLKTEIVQPPILQSPFYAVPAPPPPVKLAVSSGHAVLADPREASDLPAYTRAIGEQVPRDFRWVSVSAEFDVVQWRQRLRQPDTNDGALAIMPNEWWRDRMLMVHAVMERQKRDPRTGQWGPVEQVESLPNALVSFPPDARRFTQAETRDLLDKLSLEQREIARPQFLPLVAGAWFPPGDLDPSMSTGQTQGLSPEQQERVGALRKRLQDIQDRLAPLERQLAEANRTGAASPAAQRLLNQVQAQMAPWIQQRQDVERQIAQITGDTAGSPDAGRDGFGPGVAGGPGGPGGSGGPGGPGVAGGPGGPGGPGFIEAPAVPVRRDLDQPGSPAGLATDATGPRDTIVFWRHDVGVEPGAQYRYRLRVNMLNPLFQRSQVRREQQNDYFHKKELESEFSEWSDPVVIEPEFYYFVVNASRQAGGAEVEVYRVFDGKWRRQTFPVRPGDPVGADVTVRVGEGETALPMRVDALVVDVEFEVPIPGAALGARTAKVVLYDERRGLLFERLVEFDRADAARLRLQSLAQAN